MDLTVPNGWREVDQQLFDELMLRVNFTKDSWANGEYYNAKGYETPYELKFSDGRSRTDWREKSVGIHLTNGRCFIDPTFFKICSAP